MRNLPTIKDLTHLCSETKKTISLEYRAFEGDEEPGIQLTIGWNNETGDWGWQTGDNSYTGAAYHYPHWAVTGVYRSSNCRELARDLQSQLDEVASQ